MSDIRIGIYGIEKTKFRFMHQISKCLNVLSGLCMMRKILFIIYGQKLTPNYSRAIEYVCNIKQHFFCVSLYDSQHFQQWAKYYVIISGALLPARHGLCLQFELTDDVECMCILRALRVLLLLSSFT